MTDQKQWSGVGWGGMGWNGVEWGGMGWNGVEWGGMGWNGVEWGGVGWGGVGWGGVGWSRWSGVELDGVQSSQVQSSPVADIISGDSLRATVWTAVIAKTSFSDVDVVQVQINTRTGLDIFINGVREEFEDLPTQQFNGCCRIIITMPVDFVEPILYKN